MISNWKKIFSAGAKEEAPVDPLKIANAKIAGLQDRNAKLANDLAEALRKNRELDGLANVLRGQRDTTRSELNAATAKLACLTTRGPGGRFVKPNGAPAASLGAL